MNQKYFAYAVLYSNYRLGLWRTHEGDEAHRQPLRGGSSIPA